MELARQHPVSTFGVELQRLRTAAGYSQRALARASGLTAAYISLLEAGRRAPERAAVERLAGALTVGEPDRDALLLAAGYAPAVSRGVPTGAPLTAIARALADANLLPEDETLIVRLVLTYTEELLAGVRSGAALTPGTAEPWPLRVLAVVQEAIEVGRPGGQK